MTLTPSRHVAASTLPRRLNQLVQRWFLGPAGSFRNAARTWIYLGFVGIFLALIAVLSVIQPDG